MALSRSATRTAQHRRWLWAASACGGVAGLVLEGWLRDQAQERGLTTAEVAQERAQEIAQNVRQASGVASALLRTAMSSALEAMEQRRFDSDRFHAALAATVADLASDPPARHQLLVLGGGFFLDWLLALAYPEPSPVVVDAELYGAAYGSATVNGGNGNSHSSNAASGNGSDEAIAWGQQRRLHEQPLPQPPLSSSSSLSLGPIVASGGGMAGVVPEGGGGWGGGGSSATATAGAARAGYHGAILAGSLEAERALESLLHDDASAQLLLQRPGAAPRLLRAVGGGQASGGVAAALRGVAAAADLGPHEALGSDLQALLEVLRGRSGHSPTLQRIAAGLLSGWAAGSAANRGKLRSLGAAGAVAEVMTDVSGMGPGAAELQWELLRLTRVLAEFSDPPDDVDGGGGGDGSAIGDEGNSHPLAVCVLPLLYTAADAAATADGAMASYAVETLAAAVRTGGPPVAAQVAASTLPHLLWQLAEGLATTRRQQPTTATTTSSSPPAAAMAAPAAPPAAPSLASRFLFWRSSGSGSTSKAKEDAGETGSGSGSRTGASGGGEGGGGGSGTTASSGSVTGVPAATTTGVQKDRRGSMVTIKDAYLTASVAAAVAQLAAAALLPPAHVPRWRDWLLDVLCADGFNPAAVQPPLPVSASTPPASGAPAAGTGDLSVASSVAIDGATSSASRSQSSMGTPTLTAEQATGETVASPPAAAGTPLLSTTSPPPRGGRWWSFGWSSSNASSSSNPRHETAATVDTTADATGEPQIDGGAATAPPRRGASLYMRACTTRGRPVWLTLPSHERLRTEGSGRGVQEDEGGGPRIGRGGGGKEVEEEEEEDCYMMALRNQVVNALAALSHMPGNHGLQAAHYWLSRLLSELAARTLPYTSLVYAEGPRLPQDLTHAVPVLPSYVKSVADALERAADAVADDSPRLPPHLEFELAGSGLVGRPTHDDPRVSGKTTAATGASGGGGGSSAAAAAYLQAAHVVDMVMAEKRAAEALEALCAIVAPDPAKQLWLLHRGVLPLMHRLTRTADDSRVALRETGQCSAEQTEAAFAAADQHAAATAAAAVASTSTNLRPPGTATGAPVHVPNTTIITATSSSKTSSAALQRHPTNRPPQQNTHLSGSPPPATSTSTSSSSGPVPLSDLLSDHAGGPSLCLQRQVARMLALVALLPQAQDLLAAPESAGGDCGRGGDGVKRGKGAGVLVKGLGTAYFRGVIASGGRGGDSGSTAYGKEGGGDGGDSWYGWLRGAAGSTDCRLSSNATRALLHMEALKVNAAAAMAAAAGTGTGGVVAAAAAAAPPVFLDGLHLLDPGAAHHWALVRQGKAEAACTEVRTAMTGGFVVHPTELAMATAAPVEVHGSCTIRDISAVSSSPPPAELYGAGATRGEPSTFSSYNTTTVQPTATVQAALSYMLTLPLALWGATSLSAAPLVAGGVTDVLSMTTPMPSSPPSPEPTSPPSASAVVTHGSVAGAGPGPATSPTNGRPTTPPNGNGDNASETPSATPIATATATVASDSQAPPAAAAAAAAGLPLLPTYPAPYSPEAAPSSNPQTANELTNASQPTPPHHLQPPLVDVVFVHGIRGGPFITWRKAGVMTRGSAASHMERSACWPSTWLAEDFPGARLLSVEYLAPVSAWEGESLPLEDNVCRVMSQLAAAGVGTGQRPVVFVAHSMGGLLVKEMLARSLDQQAVEGGGPHATLATSTRGVIFFGTPHFGNGLAAMGWSLRHLPGTLPAPSLARLTPGPHLLALNDRLQTLHDTQDGRLRVTSLLEGQPTQLSGVIPRILIVAPDSAYPGFGAGLKLPYNDHIDCCKPSGKDAPAYRVVVDTVAHALRLGVGRGVEGLEGRASERLVTEEGTAVGEKAPQVRAGLESES